MSAAIPTQVPLSAEVLDYARQHHIEQCLQPLIEMTQKMFPTGEDFSIYMEQDPELRDVQSVVFDITVPDLSVDRWVAVHLDWTDRMLQICDPKLGLHFVLRLGMSA
jgi:hypothetical protein